MNTSNLILATDSYKQNHWHQYPENTEGIYSYFESRNGAKFPYTVFFGLQYILKEYLAGCVIQKSDILEARELCEYHFGSPGLFNEEGWTHIVEKHDGRLPLRIKAVPEGTPVPTGNVLMTVENTDPKCFWLTNAVESLLTHVWYPSTVATLSRSTKETMAWFLNRTGSQEGLPHMLHDFGYRGATTHEAAAIGGAGHLVNFVGTDTLPAMETACVYYGADLDTLAFSVPATEHSVMTSLGRDGEFEIVERLLKEYPTGILSVVADSYNIHKFVAKIGTTYRDRINERDGVFVVRPDSIDDEYDTPAKLTLRVVERLFVYFGGETNEKGFRVLNPKVRVLWGDGIDPRGIEDILGTLMNAGFAAENLVFGMGGGLLQKFDRDTQRFAFKCSAAKRDGEWHDVYKEPLDKSKVSKKGRLMLVQNGDDLATVGETASGWGEDVLQTVFDHGWLTNPIDFDQVRKNAEL